VTATLGGDHAGVRLMRKMHRLAAGVLGMQTGTPAAPETAVAGLNEFGLTPTQLALLTAISDLERACSNESLILGLGCAVLALACGLGWYLVAYLGTGWLLGIGVPLAVAAAGGTVINLLASYRNRNAKARVAAIRGLSSTALEPLFRAYREESECALEFESEFTALRTLELPSDIGPRIKAEAIIALVRIIQLDGLKPASDLQAQEAEVKKATQSIREIAAGLGIMNADIKKKAQLLCGYAERTIKARIQLQDGLRRLAPSAGPAAAGDARVPPGRAEQAGANHLRQGEPARQHHREGSLFSMRASRRSRLPSGHLWRWNAAGSPPCGPR